MNQFDQLTNMPGVIHRRYCSLSCGNEATGTIEVYLDETKTDTFPMPICKSCVDKATEGMID